MYSSNRNQCGSCSTYRDNLITSFSTSSNNSLCYSFSVSYVAEDDRHVIFSSILLNSWSCAVFRTCRLHLLRPFIFNVATNVPFKKFVVPITLLLKSYWPKSIFKEKNVRFSWLSRYVGLDLVYFTQVLFSWCPHLWRTVIQK